MSKNRTTRETANDSRRRASVPTFLPLGVRRLLGSTVVANKRGLAWVVGCGICAIACVDTSPVAIFKDGGVVLPPSDAPSGDVEYPRPACHACVAAANDPGPGCGNELARCDSTEHCRFIYDCAYASGCVFKKSHAESISCALPCAEQLKYAYDMAILAAVSLSMCFHAVCNDVCAVEP